MEANYYLFFSRMIISLPICIISHPFKTKHIVFLLYRPEGQIIILIVIEDTILQISLQCYIHLRINNASSSLFTETCIFQPLDGNAFVTSLKYTSGLV